MVDVGHHREHAELPTPHRNHVLVAGFDVAEQVSAVRPEVAEGHVDVRDSQRVTIGVDAVAPVFSAAVLALDHDGSGLGLGVVVQQEPADQTGRHDTDDDRHALIRIEPDPAAEQDDRQNYHQQKRHD